MMSSIKRILSLLLVVVAIMLTSTIKVEAASTNKQYDKKFKAYYNRLNNEWNEAYDNLSDEEKNVLTDIDLDYTKFGYGIYEILASFTLYGDQVLTYDIIYDVEEDDGYVYMILDNERITEDELEELYPELWDIDFDGDI